MPSAVVGLKWLVILFVVYMVLFGSVLLAAFLDAKAVVVVAAFGLLLVKIGMIVIVFWWLANFAFSVAEWVDERKTK